MQRTITQSGIDFEVEFDAAGEIDAIYIGGVEVTDIISDAVREAIETTVVRNAHRWHGEYLRDVHYEEIAARRAA